MQIAEKCLVPPLEPLPGLPAAKAAPALGRGPVHACFLSKRQSSDGKIIKVDVEIAKQSVTIKTTLEDLGMGDEGDDDPVPLPNVNAAVLKKVIQWCTHHKDDPPPPEDVKTKKNDQMIYLFGIKNS
ncbi:hypothetical protein Celaphus_00019140 [Cervus elaphus hippelaphus]|uniref:SKP1 component POZ domain-containing protein n=1 Tax=Cervus elaphus hippelaphus TaxID=46360 RepID=A0A212C7L2_CEREH|nr:hypothetical protein Celaphus_00019140 [Cervus elaphus hippelaphus]